MTNEVIERKDTVQLSPEQKRFNQAMQMAITLSRSSIVPVHFRGKPDDIFAAIQLGKELGFSPMQSLNSIVIIQGNATMKAQAMLAVVKSRCSTAVIEITEDGDDISCFAKRDEKDLGYKATWSIEKAKEAGFATAWDKDLKKVKIKDNWQKQPKVMSRWRAISEALRIIFPDILMGLYSSEEMTDVEAPVKIELSNNAEKARQLTEKFSHQDEEVLID